jgi:hypothetical protein
MSKEEIMARVYKTTSARRDMAFAYKMHLERKNQQDCEAAQAELVRRVDMRMEKDDGYIQHIIQTQEEDDATKVEMC